MDQGIQVMTKSDPEYPKKLRGKLKKYAPPILYYSGNLSILENTGVAIVGSRNIDDAGVSFTEKLARCCTNSGMNIVSGGARGVDSIAEKTSNDMEGTSLIFVADSLEKKIRNRETRNAIMRNSTLVMSARKPDTHFAPYIAMEQNKYIYGMGDYVVAVSSDYNKGGTWAGAMENLKAGWTPLFVRSSGDIPKGNHFLLAEGSVQPITEEDLVDGRMQEWFLENQHVEEEKERDEQMSMFGLMG